MENKNKMIININPTIYSDLIQIAIEYNLNSAEEVINMLIPTKITNGEI